jgi:uncharacterized damage-inducible protein DinB
MMKIRALALAVLVTLIAALCLSAGAYAQGGQDAAKTPQAAQQPAQPNPNPVSTFQKFAYVRIKGILLASAEKMPEENYNFKPTDAVRSYGQIIGHLADAQYMFCSTALGEKNPGLKIEQTKTTRADLIAALKEAVAYCDKAYDTMTDATATQPVKLFGGDMPRFGALEVNNIHDMEHYGNLVTYMRLKNIVPPTSEQQQAPPAQKK